MISQGEAEYLRDLCRERKAEIEKWRQQQKEDYQNYLDKVQELEKQLADRTLQRDLLKADAEMWHEEYKKLEGRIAEAQTISERLEYLINYSDPQTDKELLKEETEISDLWMKLRETLSPKETEKQ